MQRLFSDLHGAMFLNDSKKFRTLLHGNLNLSTERIDRNFVLSFAANCTNKKIFGIIVEFLKFGAKDIFENNLILAILDDDLESAESLLSMNGDCLKNQEWYKENLQFVFESIFRKNNVGSHKEWLLLLMKHGLNTEFRTAHGENLLHLLVSRHIKEGNFEAADVAEILLDSGISANELSNNDESLLVMAIRNPNPNYVLISFLINKGLDVNKIFKMSAMTVPLIYWATINSSYKIINILIKNGADLNVKSDTGRTALHMACFSRALSKRHDADDVISLLIRKGSDISTIDSFGETPLSLLVSDRWNNDLDVVGSCIKTVVREFARLAYQNITIYTKDLEIIQANRHTRAHFENCLKELRQMESTRFYEPYSYYSILKMETSINKLALLTKNQDFVLNFTASLNSFPCYSKDLQRLFKEAIQDRDELLAIESKLKYTFGNFLPDIAIRKLTNDLTVEDLPLF